MEFFIIFKEQFVIDFKFIVALLIIFSLDFLCGFTKGIFIEGVSSNKLRQSVPKLIGYLGLVLLCLSLDTLIILTLDKSVSIIAPGATIAVCVVEAKSVTENLKELGIDIPKIVYSGLSILSKNNNKEENKENE